MKYFAVLFLSFFFSCAGPEYITPPTSASSYERGQYVSFLTDNQKLKGKHGIIRAIEDFSEKKYYLIEYGLMVYSQGLDERVENVYKKHGIRIEFGGCCVSQAGEAYTVEMIRLLKESGIDLDKILHEVWTDPEPSIEDVQEP